MNREMKKQLDERLASMSPSQRRRLYGRALKLKRASSRDDSSGRSRKRLRKWGQSWSDGDDGESNRTRPIRSKKGDPLDEIVWRLLLEEEEIETPAVDQTEPTNTAAGTVTSVYSGGCIVLDGSREIECLLPPELAKRQQSALAVGDRISYAAGRGEELVVRQVHPRKSVLSRPDPFLQERERLIATNVDRVVIVGSIQAPPLQTRLIDRYLIAIQRGGATPIICVNKIDLFEGTADRAEALEKLEPYRSIGIDTFAVSAAGGKESMRSWPRFADFVASSWVRAVLGSPPCSMRLRPA